MSNTPATPVPPPPAPAPTAPAPVPQTTYTTADGQQITVPGPPVHTGLDTPSDLLQEMQAAFSSEAYRATTSAAMQAAPGVPAPTVDPRVNGADAAAAMQAALGVAALPAPTVGDNSPTIATPTPAPTPAPAGPSAAPPAPVLPPGAGDGVPTVPPLPSQAAPPAAPAAGATPSSAAGVPLPTADDALAALSQPPATPPAGTLPAPDAPPAPAPSGYDYRYYDPTTGSEQVRHLPDDAINQAIAQAAWIENLPDQTKAAWAAVEQGQAVAIPRGEYDRYQAFLAQSPSPIPPPPGMNGGMPNGMAPGMPPGPASPYAPPPIDYSELDPQTAAAVQQLQQQNYLAQQQLAATQAAYEEQVRAQAGQQFDQQTAARAAAFDAAIGEYARQRGLDQQETELLVEGAIRGEYVPLLDRRLSTRNQITGDVIVPADPYRVVFGALDHALTDNPALYAAVSSRASNPPAAPTPAPAPVAPNGQAAPVNPQFPATATIPQPAGVPTVGGLAPDISAKKAHAASLATAPAAAVQQAPRDVRTMSREETAQAMAGDIERYFQQS